MCSNGQGVLLYTRIPAANASFGKGSDLTERRKSTGREHLETL